MWSNPLLSELDLDMAAHPVGRWRDRHDHDQLAGAVVQDVDQDHHKPDHTGPRFCRAFDATNRGKHLRPNSSAEESLEVPAQVVVIRKRRKRRGRSAKWGT